MYLSKSEITSFQGDVLPLKLISDTDISGATIVWSSDSDAVSLRTFEGGEYGFSDGVLLVLTKVGTAHVSATLDGETYSATVTVRERLRAGEGDELNYYVGDLHDHTSKIHKRRLFAVRESDFPIDCINYVKNEGLMDFGVISDHGDVVSERDFFRGFTDTEAAEPMDLVIFPGSESEATVIERDRFGFDRKNSGEIVVINAAGYSAATSWEEFHSDFKDSPLPVATFAHPQVIGSGLVGGGLWNFKYHRINTPEMLRMMRLVEMGNGADRAENLVHEYAYSQALDAGFRVSVSCSSDSHGPDWGYRCFPGKTIVMSPKKDKEYILDALLSNRVYASESGNLKLNVRVNGKSMPCDLLPTDKYKFEVDITYFCDDATTHPKKCTLVSDNGITLNTVVGDDLSHFTFEVESDTARYFYLRFVDSEGRKTWSPPAFLGREYDKYEEPRLGEIDKSTLTVEDRISMIACDALISGDPSSPWVSTEPRADIIFDMKEERAVAAIGHYAHHFLTAELREKNISVASRLCTFVSKYRVSVSSDGENYRTVAEGIMRAFGGEEIISFPETRARYLRFEALSTVGYESDLPKYMNANITIGELSLLDKIK